MTSAGLFRRSSGVLIPSIFGIFLLLLCSTAAFSLHPGDEEIVLTLWTETSKISAVDDPVDSLLSDAKWIISSMIYGLEIVYTPSDVKREVGEVFTADLMAEIPFGDQALRVIKTWKNEGRFYVQIRYELADYQIRRTAAWSSNVFQQSEGFGRATFFKGSSARIDAVKDGIKQALSSYLRPLEKNKPREIRVRAILDEAPYIVINAGGYNAKVRIRFSIDKITPYRIY